MGTPLYEAANYISRYRLLGVSDNRIRKQFSTYGWKAEMLDQAFKEADYQGKLSLENNMNLAQNTLTKFTLWTAAKDCVKGIAFNPVAYGVAVLISFLLWLAGFFALSSMISLIVGNDEDAKLVVTLLTTIICLAILFVLYSIVSIFTTAAAGFPVFEGLLGRRISTGEVLRQSLKAVRKTSIINSVGYGIIYIPFLLGIPIVVFVTVQSLKAGHVEVDNLLSSMLCLLSFFGVLWGCLASTRLALMPQVSVFEAGLPVSLTMNRSIWLLHNGGRQFIVSGFALLVLIGFIIQHVCGVGAQGLGITDNILSVSLAIVLIIFSHTALTTLFLDRSRTIDHPPMP